MFLDAGGIHKSSIQQNRIYAQFVSRSIPASPQRIIRLKPIALSKNNQSLLRAD